MSRKMSGILFGSALLAYCIVMTMSYTSCNSGTNKGEVTAAPSSESNQKSLSDTALKKAAIKKAKRGKAVIASPAEINANSKIRRNKDGIYSHPQTMPEYPGGQSALSLYVENNSSYPQAALNDNKEGTVRVSFIVNETGIISNPEIVGNKLGDGLDQEAVNVIKNMPRWRPGRVNGKNVKTRMDLPIKFQVQDQS